MSDGGPVDIIFFDIRDTLGEVDRPGHLEPYRPSTEKLLTGMRDVGLRVGLITNLPPGVDGREMVEGAVLSQDGDKLTRISDFVEPDALITNHDAGADKPDPKIYRYAADKVGVPIERCMYVGENLIEVIGAKAAGMRAELKPCPPGREFMPAPITGFAPKEHDSGRAFEAFLEHEHLLGDRIFNCAKVIADRLKPAEESGERIEDGVFDAMGILIYLLDNFADQVHLKAEEATVPLAVARGMDPASVQWVFDHHDQCRAYFVALTVAYRRIERTERDPKVDDYTHAVDDFRRNAYGFVALMVHHAERENNELYPEMGTYFSDADDTLVVNIISHTGPADITPYVSLVAAMEGQLGIPSPPM
jgi:hemerythrin-like domain-containing protein